MKVQGMLSGLDEDRDDVEVVRTLGEHSVQVVGKVVRYHPPRHEDVVEVFFPPLRDPVGTVLNLSDVKDSPREIHWRRRAGPATGGGGGGGGGGGSGTSGGGGGDNTWAVRDHPWWVKSVQLSGERSPVVTETADTAIACSQITSGF